MSSKMWLLIEFLEENPGLTTFDVVNCSEVEFIYSDVKPGDKVFVRTQDISHLAKIVRISEDKSSVLKQKEVLNRHTKTLRNIIKICLETMLEDKNKNLSKLINSQVRKVRTSSGSSPPSATTSNLTTSSLLQQFIIDSERFNSQVQEVRISSSPSPPSATTSNLTTSSLLQQFTTDSKLVNSQVRKVRKSSSPSPPIATTSNLTTSSLLQQSRTDSELVNSQVREVRISSSPSPTSAMTSNLNTSSFLQQFTTDIIQKSFYDRHMANKIVPSLPNNIMGSSSFSSSSIEDQDCLHCLQLARSQTAPPQSHDIMAIRARSSSKEPEGKNRIWESNGETTQGFDLFPPIYNRRESNLDPIQEIRGDPLHRSTPLPTNDACAQQNKTLYANQGTQTCKELYYPLFQQICHFESTLHSLQSHLRDMEAVNTANCIKCTSRLTESELSVTSSKYSPGRYHSDYERNSETVTSIVNQAGLSRTVEGNPAAQIENTSTRSKAYVLRNSGPVRNRKRPAQQAGPSQLVEENPVAQSQDASTRTTTDVLRYPYPIRDRKRSTQQAGPSRIVEENPVAQSQDASTRTTADVLRNFCQIRDSKRPAQQAGPSQIVEEDSIAPIKDTLKKLTVDIFRQCGIYQGCKRPVQQTGPSRTVEENPIAQIQDISTRTIESDNVLRSNGPVPKLTTQKVGPSRIVKKNTVAAISNTSTIATADVSKKSAQTRNIRDLQTQDNDMVPIGYGNAKVPKSIYDRIDWTAHSTATRQLLGAMFSRRDLATSSLTGKKSPAFMNRPAKKILDPKLVEDIVKIVSARCNVPRNLVRNSITIKCADEAKLYRNRQQRNQKRKKPQNDENRPPSVRDF